MNKECCTPGPPAKEHPSGGYEEKGWGLDVYFNWPAGATRAVVLDSDVFGWEKPLLRERKMGIISNNTHPNKSLTEASAMLYAYTGMQHYNPLCVWKWKLADKIADAGFVAVVPDYFRGDYIDDPKYAADRGLWFEKHPFEPVIAETLTVIQGIKDKGIKSVGVAGFCYGGKVATVVAKEGAADAIVILHPARVTLDDIKQVKGAFAVLSAENDVHTTVSDVEEWRKILTSKNEVEYFTKVYPGVDHGWTVRYDENDEKAVKSAYESHTDAINWFKKYLK